MLKRGTTLAHLQLGSEPGSCHSIFSTVAPLGDYNRKLWVRLPLVPSPLKLWNPGLKAWPINFCKYMFIKYFLFQNTWLLPEPKIFCEDTQKLLESQSMGHWESTWLACVKPWISSHVLPEEGKWHKTLTSDVWGQGSQRLLLKQRLHGLHLATLWALSWCQQYCLGTKDFLPIVIIWNLEVIHLFLFSIYLLDIPKVISVWHCLQTL